MLSCLSKSSLDQSPDRFGPSGQVWLPCPPCIYLAKECRLEARTDKLTSLRGTLFSCFRVIIS